MNINQLKQSKFLTKGDVGKGVLVTIRGDAFQENVAKEGAPEEHRWCIEFDELEKPMVLNTTNGQVIAQITKSETSDKWNGHKIVLYEDPTVRNPAGVVVGGIRVRAPRGPAAAPVPSGINAPGSTKHMAQAKPASTPAPEPPDDPGDDVPF